MRPSKIITNDKLSKNGTICCRWDFHEKNGLANTRIMVREILNFFWISYNTLIRTWQKLWPNFIIFMMNITSSNDEYNFKNIGNVLVFSTALLSFWLISIIIYSYQYLEIRRDRGRISQIAAFFIIIVRQRRTMTNWHISKSLTFKLYPNIAPTDDDIFLSINVQTKREYCIVIQITWRIYTDGSIVRKMVHNM